MTRDYNVTENVGRPSKYTEQDFNDIINKTESDTSFAKRFNVSEDTIQGIRSTQAKRFGIKTVDRYKKQKYNKQIIDGGNKMNETETQTLGSNEEFEMKIIVDDNLSINCKVQKEMSVDDFEALVMRAKALSKASGYANVAGIKRPYSKRTIKIWSSSEIDELKKVWETMTREKLEEKFSRTFLAIRHKAMEIGLKVTTREYKKSAGQGKFWTDEEEKKLRQLLDKNIPMNEIAGEIGKKPKQCYDKVKNLKSAGRW